MPSPKPVCQCGGLMTKGSITCLKCRDQTGENNPNYRGGISNQFYRYKLIQKKRYPERVRARQIVADAIRSGRLVKENCIFCGSDQVQAHHDDYSKPLDVKWMCRPHHNMYEHGLIIQITAPIYEEIEAANL